MLTMSCICRVCVAWLPVTTVADACGAVSQWAMYRLHPICNTPNVGHLQVSQHT